MSRRWAAAALWLVVVGSIGVAGYPAGAAPRTALPAPVPSPSASAEVESATFGQLVRITGQGWGSDTSQVVSVVLCGNAALDGQIDCDADNTVAGAIRADGSFFTAIVVRKPILPCPCALRVTSFASVDSVDIPIIVVGAPVVPPHQRVFVRRAVSVHDVHLEGRGPWTSWFGAHPKRILRYQVTNTGTVALRAAATDIVWGKGSNPSGFVQAPQTGQLAVNQTKSFRVGVPMSALSFGTYHVLVRVDPFGTVGTAEATTTIVPWGLLLLLAIAAVLVGRMLLLRRRARSRARLMEDDDEDVAPALALVLGPQPGWYADPTGLADLRLWDGQGWSDETRSAGASVAAAPDMDVAPGAANGAPTAGEAGAANGAPTAGEAGAVNGAVAAAAVNGTGPAPSVPAPGWYADPCTCTGELLRLWDGSGWTEETRELAAAGNPSGPLESAGG